MSGVTFFEGSWPPSPGLEPWEIFDLQLLGAREVLGGDAEPGGRDLLDGRVVADAVDIVVPRRVLATFAAVGRHAQSSQTDGQGLVGLGAEGAEAHGSAHETPQDPVRRLDLRQVTWLRGVHQVQLVAHGGRVSQEGSAVLWQRRGVIRATRGQVLDRLDDGWCIHVSLAIGAEAGPSRVGQLDAGPLDGGTGESAELRLCERGEADGPRPRRRGREAAIGDLRPQLQDLEQLAPQVRRGGADAHPGEHLA